MRANFVRDNNPHKSLDIGNDRSEMKAACKKVYNVAWDYTFNYLSNTIMQDIHLIKKDDRDYIDDLVDSIIRDEYRNIDDTICNNKLDNVKEAVSDAIDQYIEDAEASAEQTAKRISTW